tara:strand:+ start:10278 stop:11234 length:957 start_codon:yes stop_codon:yes gene_type:complete
MIGEPHPLKFTSLRENKLNAVKLNHSHFAKSLLIPKIVRFINKFFYPFLFGAALNRYDSSLSLYGSRKDRQLYKDYSKKDSIFVNFGSGAFQHPYWKNYDFPGLSDYYKSIQGKKNKDFFPINLCEENLRLPYDNNSVSLIYSGHTIEHLEEGKAIHFLSECARILKPGGVFRIAIPSTDVSFDFSRIIFNQSNISNQDKLVSIRSSTLHVFQPSSELTEDMIKEDSIESNFNASDFLESSVQKRGLSSSFRESNPEFHISHWNHEKLANLSRDVGFDYYLPLYRGSSSKPPFRNIDVFDTTEPQVSLYGEFFGINTP